VLLSTVFNLENNKVYNLYENLPHAITNIAVSILYDAVVKYFVTVDLTRVSALSPLSACLHTVPIKRVTTLNAYRKFSQLHEFLAVAAQGRFAGSSTNTRRADRDVIVQTIIELKFDDTPLNFSEIVFY
jgi:hypothetical protein